MVRLGLDLATTTGWAVQDEDGIRWGEWELKNDSEGGRLASLYQHLVEVRHIPREIIIERVGSAPGDTARVLYGLRAIVVWLAMLWQIPVRDVAPNTLKKHCTNNGRAGKEAMRDAAKEWLAKRWRITAPSLVESMSYDAADAVCLLKWASETEGK